MIINTIFWVIEDGTYLLYEILDLNILELFEPIDCCLNCPKFNPIISLLSLSFVCSWNFFVSSCFTPDLNSPHHIAFLSLFYLCEKNKFDLLMSVHIQGFQDMTINILMVIKFMWCVFFLNSGNSRECKVKNRFPLGGWMGPSSTMVDALVFVYFWV